MQRSRPIILLRGSDLSVNMCRSRRIFTQASHNKSPRRKRLSESTKSLFIISQINNSFEEIFKEAYRGLDFVFRMLYVEVEDRINLLVVVDKKLN